MAKYLVIHRHSAEGEDCDKIGKALETYDNPYKGSTLLCTCPSGDHGGYIEVEANSSEEAKKVVPKEFRDTLKVLEMTEMAL